MPRELAYVLCAALLAAAGCSDSTGPDLRPTPPPPPDVRAYVTGAALANLDAQGHFRFPYPEVDGPYAIVSPDEAVTIAAGVVRSWLANPDVIVPPGAGSLAGSAEKSHGAPIDWDAVRPGPRGAYFAESHLEPLPAHMPAFWIRAFGPHDLVPMYVDATPVIVISVAAYATNVFVDDDGWVYRRGPASGGEFRVSGVPLALDGTTMPPGPEDVVAFVYRETGTKVSELPVLGVPGNRVTQTYARWRVVLERAVIVERLLDGQRTGTDTLYVSAYPWITDAWAGLPPTGRLGLRLLTAAPQQPEGDVVEGELVPCRAGYAIDLHEVRAVADEVQS